MLKASFSKKVGVLLLDADADSDALKWYNKYKVGLFEKGLFLCKLEKGDPADYTRDEIWEIIIESIKKGKEDERKNIV